MGTPFVGGEVQGSPEKVVAGLLGRLKRHLVWDSLLLLLPPVLSFLFFVAFLIYSGWSGLKMMVSSGAILLAAALVMVILRLRTAASSVGMAARLIDQKAVGQDRFTTLATINPSLCPPFLVARLRWEAAGLLHHVDIERDFPYRVKHSFFQSLIVSLSAILLFLLFVQIGLIFTSGAARDNKLALLEQRLSQISRFSELARSLESLAGRVQDGSLSLAEKRSIIQEVSRQLERQLAAEQQLGGTATDLLNEAADTLRGLEQGLEKGQEGGASGFKDKSPTKEKGSGSEAGQGDQNKGRVERDGQESNELAATQPGQDVKQQPNKKQAERNQGPGEREGGEKDRGGEMKGRGTEESGGKGRMGMGEETPQGKAAERFLKPGEEGEKRIQGARFVTVQLPEQEIESKAGQGGSGKRKEVRSRTPVGNVPLRQPDTPDAYLEKQHLPLEYRGLIR